MSSSLTPATEILEQRLEALTEAVAHIATSGDLSMRIGDNDDGEIAPLVQALNAALERIEEMYQALEAVIVKQRRFIADASHELRTPLTTMSSSLEAMQLFSSIGDGERQTLVANAFLEAQRLGELVNDLLMLASLDFGGRMQHSEFEWDKFLESAFAAANEQVSPRAVKTHVDDGLGVGAGDVDALQNLIVILADNIAVHTPSETAVTFNASQSDNGAVSVTISDDGPGVSPRMLANIFERFVQGDPSRHRSGSGMGLAIGRAIAAEHGGTLTAELVEPHGLRMNLTIPPPTITQPRERRRASRPL